MYSILIVDDEELICKGMKSMIERSCHKNIGSICHAVEPLGIMRLIEEHAPDIIITDIRMPEMSGLELIRLVTDVYPRIKFIVLSGYDDFNYVKDAFKLGVIDYLLKPASMEEVNAVLGKVISAIDDERQRSLDQKSKSIRLMQAVMENKLNKIFAGAEMQEEGVESFYAEIRGYFQFSEFLICIISKGYSINGNGQWVAECIEKSEELFSHMKSINAFNFFSLSNNFILLINMESEKMLPAAISNIEKVIEGLESSLGMQLFIAASNTATGTERISSCYKQAREALDYRIIFGAHKIIFYRDIECFKKETVYDRQLIRIKDSVLSFKQAQISSTIDELFDPVNLRNCSIESIRKMYAGAVRALEEAAAGGGMQPVTELAADFDRFNRLSDIRIYLKTRAFDMISRLKELHKNKSVIDIVKKYINENLHKDIDMAVAANVASVSYSHFSKLFKHETGMNFSDYIIKARMEKALEMLGDPVNRVQDISFKVGYGNPKHFTRAFKNHFGFSPSEYRAGAVGEK